MKRKLSLHTRLLNYLTDITARLKRFIQTHKVWLFFLIGLFIGAKVFASPQVIPDTPHIQRIEAREEAIDVPRIDLIEEVAVIPVSEPKAVTGDVWGQLAMCESGGNPRAVDPSGTYFGLYQFDISTWQSNGGSGNPIDNSPAEQLRVAKVLHSHRGFSPWPSCASKLGLL